MSSKQVFSWKHPRQDYFFSGKSYLIGLRQINIYIIKHSHKSLILMHVEATGIEVSNTCISFGMFTRPIKNKWPTMEISS